MFIDCDRCELREIACDDCVVSVMLAGPDGEVEIGAPERRALHVLADGGLIPPLRWTISIDRAS